DDLRRVLVIDLARVVDPIDVDAEFLIALAVGFLDVAGGGFAHHDVAGGRPEGARDLVFLQGIEPLLGMGVHFFRTEHAAAGDGYGIVGIEIGDALRIIGAVKPLDVLDPSLGIFDGHAYSLKKCRLVLAPTRSDRWSQFTSAQTFVALSAASMTF